MHTLACASPSHALQPFVIAYAQRVFDSQVPLLEPVPARLEPTLEFQFAEPLEIHFDDGRRQLSPDIVVVGAQTRCAVTVLLRGKIESFGVFFKPSGYYHLFGVPTCHLTDRSYDARLVVGSWLSQVRSQLAACPSFHGRVAIIDQLLLSRVAQANHRDPIAAAANYLLAVRGAATISLTAQTHGLSVRQFERLFSNGIGLSPKRFARIARFQAALDSKISFPSRSWLRIAHDLCYHDQMHMVHDFAEFAPSCPSRIMSQLGDMRPPALLAQDPSSRDCRIFTSP